MNSFLSIFGHAIGLIGMAMVVACFYFSVCKDWDVKGMLYNVVNASGATLLLISLLIHFNLGSFVIEIFWITISVRGILNAQKKELEKELEKS
jgi:predicted membrane protein